jgi:hypothetical protein
MTNKKITPGHWHEAVDRTNCVSEIIENMLLQHVAIREIPEIRRLVEDAQSKLEDAYQLLGVKLFEENEKND